MIDFAAELDVDWFMLYNFVPTGRGANMVDSDLTPDEREDILRICWDKMKTSEVNVLSTAPQFARIAQQIEANPPLTDGQAVIASGVCEEEGALVVPTHFSNTALPGQLKQLADFIGGCGAGRFYLSLEPNDDMFPCVFFPHEEAVKVGNLFKDDFEKVWRHSELFWKIRDKTKLSRYCGDCQYRYTCGGCRARAYSYFRDILAPDPGCVVNRTFWKQLQTEFKKDLSAEEAANCQESFLR